MEKKTGKGGFTKKLTISLIIVGVLPLIIFLTLALYWGSGEIHKIQGANFQALASETSRRVDLAIAEETTRNLGIAEIPEIVRELERIRDEISQVSPEQITSRIAKEEGEFKLQDSEFQTLIIQHRITKILVESVLGSSPRFSSNVSKVARSATRVLYVTDVLGRVVATTNPNVPYLNQQTDWWKGSFRKNVGNSYIGNLQFDDRFQTYTFSISLPVFDSIRYEPVGVLHRVYDAKEFFAPSVDLIRFGKTGHVMLIDSDGLVISCPILATGLKIADPQLIRLVTPLEAGWVLVPTDGHGRQGQTIIGFSPLPKSSHQMMDSTNKAWHLFVWQASEELFEPMNKLQKWIIYFGLISFVLILTLAILVSRRVVRPLRHLQYAAKLIASRKLSEPIAIKTGDEIEELAEEFNLMNAQLQAAFSGLLSEVEAKNKEVEFLRESTTQIVECSPDPVAMVEENLEVHYMNRAFKNAAGLNNGWGEKQNLVQLLSLNTHQQQNLQRHIHSSLGLSPTAASGNGGEESQASDEMNDPLLPKNRQFTLTNEQFLKIGNRIFRYECFPITQVPGKNLKCGFVLRDTTDEKRLQDELINSEKSSSLGVLCSGISHELNNPLVGVIGLAEAIQEEAEVDTVKAHAKAIVQQGQRMAKVIRDLTGQVRNQSKSVPMALDLNEQLDMLLKYISFQEDYPEIEVQKDFHDLPPFFGTPEEVRLVFFHVLKNAIQAMEGKGRLTLGTETNKTGAIEIRIQDTGTGIHPNLLHKVFDPFFTTKHQGEGNGLGLTIVQRIVKKYGGMVELESEEGQGTKCRIILPTKDHSKS